MPLVVVIRCTCCRHRRTRKEADAATHLHAGVSARNARRGLGDHCVRVYVCVPLCLCLCLCVSVSLCLCISASLSVCVCLCLCHWQRASARLCLCLCLCLFCPSASASASASASCVATDRVYQPDVRGWQERPGTSSHHGTQHDEMRLAHHDRALSMAVDVGLEGTSRTYARLWFLLVEPRSRVLPKRQVAPAVRGRTGSERVLDFFFTKSAPSFDNRAVTSPRESEHGHQVQETCDVTVTMSYKC